MIKVISGSEKETKSLAANFAHRLKGGECLALKGELGSGKTTFVKGLARGFGVKKKIRSPSFVIIKAYQLPGQKTFYHIDLYRLKSSKEFSELGFSEILKNQANIVAIEWPDKIKKFLPKKTIYINFALGKTSRERTISFAKNS